MTEELKLKCFKCILYFLVDARKKYLKTYKDPIMYVGEPQCYRHNLKIDFVSICECKHQDLKNRNIRLLMSQKTNCIFTFELDSWVFGCTFFFSTSNQFHPIMSKIMLARQNLPVASQFASNRDNRIFSTCVLV